MAQTQTTHLITLLHLAANGYPIYNLVSNVDFKGQTYQLAWMISVGWTATSLVWHLVLVTPSLALQPPVGGWWNRKRECQFKHV